MKTILSTLVLVLFTSSAWAGIYLEPYVGYEGGTIKGDVNDSTNGDTEIDYKAKGATFGGKLGYSLLLFAGGLDYMSGSLKGTSGNTDYNDDTFKDTDFGAFLQFSVPLLFKLSATYFFDSKAKGDYTYKGNGSKIGIGFTMIPFLSINVDVINISYDKTNAPVNTFSADLKALMVGVSVPLDF